MHSFCNNAFQLQVHKETVTHKEIVCTQLLIEVVKSDHMYEQFYYLTNLVIVIFIQYFIICNPVMCSSFKILQV